MISIEFSRSEIRGAPHVLERDTTIDESLYYSKLHKLQE